jgi:hypothetical protein
MGTVNKTEWKKAKVHEGITLPSGVKVDITIPNLTQMVATGALPNELTAVALRQQEADKIDEDVLRETWKFVKHIVPVMLVNPKITEDDVEELPIEDLEMLASFATRQADLDAVGHHLGGLETSRSFRELRGLISLDEALESV